MNIHEHQAKEILKEYQAPVSNGVVIYSIDEIKEKILKLKSKQYVLKAQIHAGGRGKAGGVKLIKNLEDLLPEAKKMMGKILITHQTGSKGKKVKRLYNGIVKFGISGFLWSSDEMCIAFSILSGIFVGPGIAIWNLPGCVLDILIS